MAQICFILIGGCCEEICSGGKSCRQFGKYICLCEKGKTGKNCKENGTLFLFPSVLSYVRINKKLVSERLFIGRRYFRDFCTTYDTGNANVKQLILHFNPST